MSLLILAVEDGTLFDSAFAQHMRLPFSEGWNHWEVYARAPGSRHLMFRGEFDRLEFAEAYVTAASDAPATGASVAQQTIIPYEPADGLRGELGSQAYGWNPSSGCELTNSCAGT